MGITKASTLMNFVVPKKIERDLGDVSSTLLSQWEGLIVFKKPPCVDFGLVCSDKGSSSTDTESISSLIFKEDLHYLGLIYVSDNISGSAVVNRDTSQGTFTFETKEIDVTGIIETTPLRVCFSPVNNEPLLADGLVSIEVLEYNASCEKDIEVTPIQRLLSDRELLDRVADTEWDSASSRLLPRWSARLNAKKLVVTYIGLL
ncbi:unnamed protein product [Cuscuta europaea]|uniref:Uncharacterized protein n=1 Tax=Cuscuta europaea TaxID=41803 RepID=A0A9P0ZWT2_CUSEU|nr:unnamed protein product [Cuscuta europaea]